ncbi:Tautomerase/MIF [Parathielavia appendiculata]|uniref:L-dopachrome isomerase n=1 Tax=Parathielavia appendiculata TaxID=2587402 RepID=A0AAN6Z3F7_9PEZI|nr:Tautomerase/MIF [Parathielavia appendiculata]
MNGAPRSAATAASKKTKARLALSDPRAQNRSPQPAAHLVEGNHVLRDIDRAPPGDIVRKTSESQSGADLARKSSKKNFFEDAFSVYTGSSAREWVHGDAMVLAEVKTNVIISDEYTFITEFSYQLSTRYQRPVSSIVVTLQHGACMSFGGSFDPAYVMSVYALPSQLLPTTNKRNAALIQKHMHGALGVDPARGFLRFVPVPEEHLACNGKTMAGEIDELERRLCEGGDGRGVDPPQAEQRARKKMSVKSLAAFRLPPAADMPTAKMTPPTSVDEGWPAASQFTTGGAIEPGPTHSPQPKSTQRKTSFVATIFGRSTKSSSKSVLPAIADER